VFVPMGLPSCYIADLAHIMVKELNSQSEIIEGCVEVAKK